MSQDYESALSKSWKIYATAFEIIGEEPNEAFKWVFKQAYALGKQEKDADTVIQGWVARDEDNTLTLFYGSDKPYKADGDDYWSVTFGNTLDYLNQNMFPDVKWEDPEPTRVELIIKRKKNG